MRKMFFGDIKNHPHNNGLLKYCYDESKPIEDRMNYLIDLVLHNNLTAYYYKSNGRCVAQARCEAKIQDAKLTNLKVYRPTIYEFTAIFFLSSIVNYDMRFGEINRVKIVVSDSTGRYKGELLTIPMQLVPKSSVRQPVGIAFNIWREVDDESSKN